MVSNQIGKLISPLLYITFEYNVCFICEKKKNIVIEKNQIRKPFGTVRSWNVAQCSCKTMMIGKTLLSRDCKWAYKMQFQL